MKHKTLMIIIAVTIVWMIMAAFLVHRFIWGNWSNNDLDRYIELTESSEKPLPKLDALGAFQDVQFKYYRKNMLIFFSDAYTLRLAYDEANYQREKEKLLQTYVYQTETISDREGYDKEPFFELNPFSFRMLSLAEYRDELLYPKEMVFVGFSDETQEIAIVFYDDFDLDYIDTSFPEFLKQECGWE